MYITGPFHTFYASPTSDQSGLPNVCPEQTMGQQFIMSEWVWLGVRGLEWVSANTPGSLARQVITKHNCVMGFVYGMRRNGRMERVFTLRPKQWDTIIRVLG